MTIQAPPDKPEEQHEVPHSPAPGSRPDRGPDRIKGPKETEQEHPERVERKADVTRAQEDLEQNVRRS